MNGWDEAKRLVEFRLDQHGKEIEKLTTVVTRLDKRIEGLGARHSVWGAVAGAITSFLAILAAWFAGWTK